MYIMSSTLLRAIDAFLRHSTYSGTGLLLCPLCAHKRMHARAAICRMPAVLTCPLKHRLIDHILITMDRQHTLRFPMCCHEQNRFQIVWT